MKLTVFQGDTKLGEVAKEDTFDAMRSLLESVAVLTVKDMVASEGLQKSGEKLLMRGFIARCKAIMKS